MLGSEPIVRIVLTAIAAATVSCDSYRAPRVPDADEIAVIEYRGGFNIRRQEPRTITDDDDKAELLNFLKEHRHRWQEGTSAYIKSIREVKFIADDGSEPLYMLIARDKVYIWSNNYGSDFRGGAWKFTDDERKELFGYLRRST